MKLQTWLNMDETRTSFTCQPEHLLTTAQFRDELQTTINELRLPLSIDIIDVEWVEWERSITSQSRIVVTNSVNSDIKLLAGVDVIGLVTIVERKTVLDPPIKTPEKLTVPENLPLATSGCVLSFLFGILALTAGGLNGGPGGALWWILSWVTFFYAVYAWWKNSQYNQQRQELEVKQKKSILDWVERIVVVAERSKIDSTSVNLSTAFDQALKATTKRVFEERGAIKTAEERKLQSSAEIREKINSRENALK